MKRPSTYSLVFASAAKMPFLAPASMAMLAMVKRDSIDRASMTGPVNSMASYSTPSTPIWPMV